MEFDGNSQSKKMFRTEFLKLSVLKSKENPPGVSVLNGQKKHWLRRSKRGKPDHFVWHCYADFRWTNPQVP